MISAISPIFGPATHASLARSNADFLRQYTDFADSFYNPPANPGPAAPAAGDQPARPLTRALPNLKSAGVFSYLRGAGKSGAGTGGQSHAAAVRSSAQAAAEVPIMPPMAQAGERPNAIHDAARSDNPLQVDGAHRTRIPASDDSMARNQQHRAQLAPLPAMSEGDGGVTRAIRERNRAMLTVFKGSGDIYRSFSGLYAA